MIKKFKNGFGILEVLIAGMIVIMVLGALVFVARTAIDSATYSMQRSQAVFLAQEGMEGVRQIRDKNYIDQDPYTRWNYLVCWQNAPSGTPCAKDAQNLYSFIPNFGTDYYFIYPATQPFNKAHIRLVVPSQPVDFGDGTIFTRTITFSENLGSLLLPPPSNVLNPGGSDKNAYKVKVTVKWNYKNREGNVVVEEILANSRQQF